MFAHRYAGEPAAQADLVGDSGAVTIAAIRSAAATSTPALTEHRQLACAALLHLAQVLTGTCRCGARRGYPTSSSLAITV